jgi:guanylate kinase
MEPRKIVIFCAPSGSGKTTITKRMMALFPQLAFSISATSRAPRGTEQDGVDYHFVSKDQFKQMIEADEFVEWEAFYDNYYGTLRREVDGLVAVGKVPVFDIDVKGAVHVKQMFGDHVLMVFVKAPTEVVIARLKARATDSPEEIQKRIDRFPEELTYESKADVVIENIDLDVAVAEAKQALETFLGTKAA